MGAGAETRGRRRPKQVGLSLRGVQCTPRDDEPPVVITADLGPGQGHPKRARTDTERPDLARLGHDARPRPMLSVATDRVPDPRRSAERVKAGPPTLHHPPAPPSPAKLKAPTLPPCR